LTSAKVEAKAIFKGGGGLESAAPWGKRISA
jgi:hypothetical protein